MGYEPNEDIVSEVAIELFTPNGYETDIFFLDI